MTLLCVEGMANISPAKDRDTAQPIWLSNESFFRLEELKQQTQSGSIADVVEEAVEVYSRLRSTRDKAAYERLTPRLRQVLLLIAEGSSTKEIAFRLHISLKTVEFHRAQLMKRLGIEGIAGLVRFAIRVGVVLP
jgi:DNA-binding NarL/FixJ family response regulator